MFDCVCVSGSLERACLYDSTDVCDSQRRSVPAFVHVVQSMGIGEGN